MQVRLVPRRLKMVLKKIYVGLCRIKGFGGTLRAVKVRRIRSDPLVKDVFGPKWSKNRRFQKTNDSLRLETKIWVV